MSTLTETCACGATFTITASHASTVDFDYSAIQWRKGHRHAESVGICGAQSAAMQPGGERSICVLKARHDGWHADDGGMHWREVPQNGPETATEAIGGVSGDSRGADEGTGAL